MTSEKPLVTSPHVDGDRPAPCNQTVGKMITFETLLNAMNKNPEMPNASQTSLSKSLSE